MTRTRNDRDMHRHVDWMVPADVSVLEYLYASRTARGKPSIQTPKTIARNTGYSRKHASARCRELANHDLVERVAKGEYRLTERGEKLLDDEIELEEL